MDNILFRNDKSVFSLLAVTNLSSTWVHSMMVSIPCLLKSFLRFFNFSTVVQMTKMNSWITRTRLLTIEIWADSLSSERGREEFASSSRIRRFLYSRLNRINHLLTACRNEWKFPDELLRTKGVQGSFWFHLRKTWTRHVIPFTAKRNSEKYYWLQNAMRYSISKSLFSSCHQ